MFWKNPLFHESVRRLLNHPRIEIVGATSDRANVLAQVETHHPDIVLVEEDDGGSLSASTLELLEASSADMRVFQLSLANNQLRVYHRQLRSIGQVEDLLRLIRAD
ncbi:MAG: response regulator transcription factor [Chloroflexi bacterium]|nr:response regulator transcription factor [Chloroflexota bacterium]